MPLVSFNYINCKLVIKDKLKIKHFVPYLFSEHAKQLCSLNIIFCTDDYLLSLNSQFLQHDYYTDILTFDLSTEEEIIAEIYISVERVKENAIHIQTTFQNELLRVIFHGALHLCGFGDKSAKDKRRMTILENDSLMKFEAFHVKQ